MTGKEAFQVWAPAGKKWVDWVRPVPFVGMKEYSKAYQVSIDALPTVDFLKEQRTVVNTNTIVDKQYANAAIIVDLPGAEGVAEGIALARVGFRPIPIYNGTIEQQGARATVDNQSVGIALSWGAEELRSIVIHDDAPPAFLVDSNRMHRFKMDASLFDNSWDVYPQDLPSSEYFVDNGVHKIIIIGEAVSKDLKKILYEFQKKGIAILWTKGYEVPGKITIHRPFFK